VKPRQFFVRVWTVDPNGEGPDDERDTDCASRKQAIEIARDLRAKGETAAAFERRNIQRPDFCPPGVDPPAHLYDFDETQIDVDEIDSELDAFRHPKEDQ
jgi:hypothetical protein